MAATHDDTRASISELSSGPSYAELSARLEAVAAIAKATNLLLPLSELLNLIAETTCGLMGYDFCAVLLPDENLEFLIIEGAYGLSSDYIAQMNGERPIRLGTGAYGEGPSSQAFRSGRSVKVADTIADPSFGPWAGVAAVQGFHSLLSVPMQVKSGTLGTMNCYTAQPHEFSAAEVALLETIANQAAIAVEAASLHHREQATIQHLEELNRSLESQRSLLERAEEIHRDLTDVVLANEGLHSIAVALANLLNSPILIEDLDGQVLASAPLESSQTSPPRQRIANDPKVLESLAHLAAVREVLEIPAQPNSGRAERCVLAPIVIGHELVGCLWALAIPAPVGPLERRALEHGATVVALELLKERIAHEVEWRLRGDLLSDLLTGDYGDEAGLLERATNLGHDLSLPHTPLVLAVDPRDNRGGRPPHGQDDQGIAQRRLVSVIQSLASGPTPRPLVASRGKHVVALWPSAPFGAHARPVDVAETIRREAGLRLGGDTVSVAVGTTCERPGELAPAYRKARNMLELVQRSDSHDRVVSLEQLGVYRLLLNAEQPDELASFSTDILGPIQEYDLRHHTELTLTLRTYLDHGCNATQTAGALGVHVNTLLYRLSRIEALTGLDIRHSEALLQTKLAFMIQEVLDLNGPPR